MEKYKIIATKSNGDKVSIEIEANGIYDAREKAFHSCYRFGLCFEELLSINK